MTVTWGSTGIRVNYGPLTRTGNELFVDAAAEYWTGPAGAAMTPVRARYELGALPPGEYAFTLRSRTGVVETKYFTVG